MFEKEVTWELEEDAGVVEEKDTPEGKLESNESAGVARGPGSEPPACVGCNTLGSSVAGTRERVTGAAGSLVLEEEVVGVEACVREEKEEEAALSSC